MSIVVDYIVFRNNYICTWCVHEQLMPSNYFDKMLVSKLKQFPRNMIYIGIGRS